MNLGYMETRPGRWRRIRDARLALDLSRPALGRKVGVSHVMVGKWEDPKGGDLVKIRHDNMVRLARALHRSTEWVDKGEPHAEDRVGESPAGAYRPSARSVPLISFVRAGEFESAEDPFAVGEADDWLPCPKSSFGPRTYALRVDGESMTAPHGRSYPDGSVIFVDPDMKAPANGARIIAKLHGTDEVTFKCFMRDAGGRLWLKPLNPQHPAITDPFDVLGTVIGKWEDE